MINKIKNFIKKNKYMYEYLEKSFNYINKIKEKIKVLLYIKSQYSRELRELKDKHKGERCFIIGNGPSLKVEDLEKLKDEVTFASHRIYNIFSKTDWRPYYYCAQDFVLINECKEEINKIECVEKFLPINIKWIYDINVNKSKYFYLNTENFDEFPKFSNNISKEVNEGFTVTYCAIQLANYMGFNKIYLLGVDHNYSTIINNKGEIIHNNDVIDYFSDNDNNKGFNLPNLDKSTIAYIKAKKFAEENNIKIYNATRGGNLEVFERVDFNNILKNKN